MKCVWLPSDKRTDSHVQTVSSIDFELDEDLSDKDIANGSVATESKEKLEWRKRHCVTLIHTYHRNRGHNCWKC